MNKLFLVSLGLSLAILTGARADSCSAFETKSMQPQSCCKGCLGGWGGKAEFLLWTAAQSELSYAILSETPPNAQIIGPIKYMGFDWDPGVRVGLNYRFPCTCWSIGAEFTYIEFRAHGPLAVAPEGGTLYTPLAYPTDDNSGKGFASEDINYYLLDFVAKRPFCFGSSYLSPLFGVRLVEIDQDLRYVYFDDPAPSGNNKGSADLEFLGAGLVGGLEGEGRICGNFSVFGGFSLGIVAGRGRNQQRQDSLNPQQGGAQGPVRVRLKFDTGKAVVDLKGGLQWCCGRLALKAGYEFHHWINTAQYVRFLDVTNQQAALPATHGHISMHGLVLTATYQL